MSGSFAPTGEQQVIIDRFLAGENLVIEAGAGTGKTATLKLLTEREAQTQKRSSVYVAYNKAMAVEAREKFPASVDCRTSHSLAFRSVGVRFKSRIDRKVRLSNYKMAPLVGIDQDLWLDRETCLKPSVLTELAREVVRKYMYSADPDLGPRHMAFPAGELSDDQKAAIREIVLPAARNIWADLASPEGKLQYEMDAYLKLWQLSQPTIPADIILFDEAQDANGAIADILQRQTHAQLVAVGDTNQQLYAWRGAVNALASWPADSRLYLTQSWRFGAAIAGEANQWLSLLDTPLRLTGAPNLTSVIRSLKTADAVLCRTNATAFAQIIERVGAGENVALVGDLTEIKKLVGGLYEIKDRKPSSHPELALFHDWDQIVEYTEKDSSGRDLAPLVKLVDTTDQYSVSTTLNRVSQVKEEDADVVISTAHKAKGRQWSKVIIADDFSKPRDSFESQPGGTTVIRTSVPSPADLMLAYVAITRAQHALDRGSLAWIDDWIKQSGSAPTIIRPASKVKRVNTQPYVTPTTETDYHATPPAAQPSWIDKLKRLFK